MLYKTKRFVATVLALAACLAFAAFAYAKNSVALYKTAGERTFYLYSASSQSLMKTSLSLRDIPRVRGESVCFSFQKDAEMLVKSIFDAYGAEIAFTESACGVTSYYGYGTELDEPIFLNGKAINLHVAVTESRCAVGTPIIFGGF